MRNLMKVAGIALLMAACGGGNDTANGAPAATPEPPAAAAPAGATHDVNMVQEGTTYHFVPAELTIASGDIVNFHNVSGGPHNVQFFADSIPAGTADALNAAMPGDKLEALSGPLLATEGEVYSITFAGLPGGEYKFTCLPHMALGMHGKITIQ